jgi:hypothetical protein
LRVLARWQGRIAVERFLQLLLFDCLETAHYPECTGYNLAIPAGATINVIIERSNYAANGGNINVEMRDAEQIFALVIF